VDRDFIANMLFQINKEEKVISWHQVVFEKKLQLFHEYVTPGQAIEIIEAVKQDLEKEGLIIFIDDKRDLSQITKLGIRCKSFTSHKAKVLGATNKPHFNIMSIFSDFFKGRKIN